MSALVSVGECRRGLTHVQTPTSGLFSQCSLVLFWADETSAGECSEKESAATPKRRSLLSVLSSAVIRFQTSAHDTRHFFQMQHVRRTPLPASRQLHSSVKQELIMYLSVYSTLNEPLNQQVAP